jgi:hypothetical protein
MLQALIPHDAATAIAIVGLFATIVGAAVALFNSWKSVCWKRAELANNYIKDFNNNEEMVFAGRCGAVNLLIRIIVYTYVVSAMPSDISFAARVGATAGRWKAKSGNVGASISVQTCGSAVY